MTESYGPRERIRRKKDFFELYKRGVCARGKYFNLIYLPNGLGYSRMAAVASRKIGSAVVRNKVRRRARELFRRNKAVLTSSWDILLIAKKDIVGATWQDLEAQYLGRLKTVGKEG
jgi:ribonuclease P protein component